MTAQEQMAAPAAENAHPALSPLARWEGPAVAGVLVLALVLRVIGLNASLWFDEVVTLTNFVRLPLGLLVQEFSSLNNHMFYSLQAKASVALFGESAWALRLPALIFGMASLALIWWIARQAAGRAAALLTLLLLAVSYHHVWFTQNARGYTELLFWTSAAMLLFAEGLRRPLWRTWVLYGACLAAAMYSHLSAGLFFIVHGLMFVALSAAAFLRPQGAAARAWPGARAPSAYGGFVLGGVLTLALHAPLISQVLQAVGTLSEGSKSSAMAEWNNPLRTLQEVLGSVEGLGPLAPVALIGGVALIGLGAVLLVRRSPLLATVYLVHIPLSLILLKLLSFRIWPRYFFIDIGFIFICVALAAVAIAAAAAQWMVRHSALRRLSWTPLVAGSAVMVCASLVLLSRNYVHPKQDFEGAIALVEARRQPNDITTSAGLVAEPIKNYFRPQWPVVETAADLDRLLSEGRTVWLVTGFKGHTRKTRPDVMQRVDASFDEVAELPGTMGDGYMSVYRSRPK